MLKKVKKEHLQLNSYSRMRVNLAAQVWQAYNYSSCNNYYNIIAQVLSSTVANAFSYYSLEETEETEKFVRYFDKFFDCVNV